MVYRPGGRATNENSPLASVIVVRSASGACERRTVAPGSTPPLGSFTVPRTIPTLDCASRLAAASNATNAPIVYRRIRPPFSTRASVTSLDTASRRLACGAEQAGYRASSNRCCAGRAISAIERARTPDGVQRGGYRIQFVRSRGTAPLSTSEATRSPMARHDVNPGDSIPDAWTTNGFSRSRRIRKSANDSAGEWIFARMPLPPSRRSSSLTSWSSRRAGSRKASTGRRWLS